MTEHQLRIRLARLRWPAMVDGGGRVRDPSGVEHDGLLYRGPADFVLEHGRFEERVITAAHLGAPRACYGNSIIQATLGQAAGFPIDYVEGFAVPPGWQDPVQHAWVRCAGYGVECTWQTPGSGYIGVVFSVERADEATWDGDATVLDDPGRGHPLLRQRWYGETDGYWPPSERLELIRGVAARSTII